MPTTIEPPDILGFEYSMKEALVGQPELISRVEAFCDRFRRLDDWKLRNERVKNWSVLEPCYMNAGPAIVMSLGPIRVSVRVFPIPLRRAEFPISGKVTWVDPKNLIKVAGQTRWTKWREDMRTCGHEPTEWGPPAFEDRFK